MTQQAVSKKEAAKLLCLNEKTVYALTRSGKLPYQRSGARQPLRILLADIEAYRATLSHIPNPLRVGSANWRSPNNSEQINSHQIHLAATREIPDSQIAQKTEESGEKRRAVESIAHALRCGAFPRKSETQVFPEQIPNIDCAPSDVKKIKLPSRFPYAVKNGNSTVMIYRHENGRYQEFKVSHYVHGKRKLETVSSFDKAFRRAKNINENFNAGDVDALGLNAAERQEYASAKEILKPFGVSLISAVMTFAEAQDVLGTKSLLKAARYYTLKNPEECDKKTVSEIVSEFLQMKASLGLSKHYIGLLGWVLKGREHQEHARGRPDKSLCATFKCFLSDITREDLKSFLAQGFSTRSRNLRVGVIKELFEYAKLQNYLPPGFCEHQVLKKARSKDSNIEIYTPEEVSKLLCSPVWERAFEGNQHQGETESLRSARTILAICAFAGLRVSEALKLDWAQVGIGGGKYIEVKGRISKTRQRRLVPMTENLRAWLAPVMKSSGPIWSLKETAFYQRRAEEVKKIEGFHFKNNALRHSYISYRMAETSDAARVSLEAGNSPQIVFQHYRELVMPDAAEKWFAIVPPESSDKITYLAEALAG